MIYFEFEELKQKSAKTTWLDFIGLKNK